MFRLWFWIFWRFSWYQGCCRGLKGPGVKLTTHLHLEPRLKMCGATNLLSIYAFISWTWTNFLWLAVNTSRGSKFQPLKISEPWRLFIVVDKFYVFSCVLLFVAIQFFPPRQISTWTDRHPMSAVNKLNLDSCREGRDPSLRSVCSVGQGACEGTQSSERECPFTLTSRCRKYHGNIRLVRTELNFV